MNRTLILTGWFYPEYLASAAVRYQAHRGKADVFGVSMAELASTLETKGLDYDTVEILGVGLTDNLERLGRILGELKAKGKSVVWYSREPIPKESADRIATAGGAFSAIHVKSAPTLLAVVASLSSVSPLLAAVAESKSVSLKDYVAGRLSEAGIWHLLHQAAGFAHRDHADEAACGDVVRALAEGASVTPTLPPRLRQLMDDWQAGYRIEILGKSTQITETRQRLLMASRFVEANVLILGETGTGKQFAAEYIHGHSGLKGSFRHYNCAYGGSDDMLMDRLFGHMKGAFTGATATTTGLFDDADNGTLFLDEIGEMGEKVQAMLLTVIETGSFVRVGGGEKDRVKVKVRLVSATNRDLQQMVLDGKFRLDLYQRICEFPVRIAPLRERKEDIAVIMRHYWHNMTGKSPTKRQIVALESYDYPGNVRELIALLKQAKALGESDFAKILSAHESFNSTLINGLRSQRQPQPTALDLPDSQKELLCLHAVKIYQKYNQNLTAACAAAGISQNTLKKYLKLSKQ